MTHNFNQKSIRALAALGFTAISMAFSAPVAHAQGTCIAGVAPFKVGQKGILIKHQALGKNMVIVQPTNTAGYSPMSNSTYFNVLKIRSDNFQVQHKRTDDGTPIALDFNVSLGWIACTL